MHYHTSRLGWDLDMVAFSEDQSAHVHRNDGPNREGCACIQCDILQPYHDTEHLAILAEPQCSNSFYGTRQRMCINQVMMSIFNQSWF